MVIQIFTNRSPRRGDLEIQGSVSGEKAFGSLVV